MIDLDEPIDDSEANRLRNQILALKNVIVQFSGGDKFDETVIVSVEMLLAYIERRFESWTEFLKVSSKS